jgi:hypothetical protein
MSYRVEATGSSTDACRITFDSVSDFVGAVYDAADAADPEEYWTREIQNSNMNGRARFTGCETIENAVRLAGRGLKAEGLESVAIAKDVIKELQQERQLPEFEPVWDVSGLDVDIERYLTGEPECMIEYPVAEVLATGPVVTLVVGMNYSAIISKDAILAQGQFCVALALALAECGYSLEIWSEIHVGEDSPRFRMRPGWAIKVRTKVLEAGTSIDPGGLMFALAHPSMLRIFGFAAMHLAPKTYRYGVGVGGGYGYPWPIDSADWPENAIILNTRAGQATTEELRDEVLDQLRALGILKDGE